MKIRPMLSRYIVFHVPIQRKLASGIYKANSKRGSMSRVESVWIAGIPKSSTIDVKLGDHCLIYDAFELTHVSLDLWHLYKDLPEFCGLLKYAESVDGDVKTKILTEDSLWAVDNDYEVQSVDTFTRYSDVLKDYIQNKTQL